MNDIAKDLSKRGRQTMDFIQIGVEVGSTLKGSLIRFFDMLRENKYQVENKSLKEIYKEMKGKSFKSEGKFLLYQKSHGVNTFEQHTVDKEEVKQFEKMCKEYGIDYLYQERPANLEDLFEKKQRGEKMSSYQEKIVDAFTRVDENGNISLKEDIALITFPEKDLEIMERVMHRLDERKSIKELKTQAKEIVEKKKEEKQKEEKDISQSDKKVKEKEIKSKELER